MKTGSLAVMMVVAAPAISAAQTQNRPGADPPDRGSPPPAALPLDLNKIDPLTFKAMAARLPKGVTPKIDWRQADVAWELARPTGTFYQREPAPGMPSTERTEFRVLYDDRQIAYTSSPRHRVTGTGLLQAGSYYNGDKTSLGGTLGLLPRDTLLVELAYTRNNIRLPLTPAYVTNTLSTRVSCSFTPSLFVKGFLQYNDAQKRASLNLLLWSIYRPGSDFYIVYNQGWDTNLPGGPDARVRTRSLSVKLTYWLSR